MQKCLLCDRELEVPVKPLFTCFESEQNYINIGKCKGRFCLVCIREYLQLNEDSKNRKSVVCPVCKKTEIECSTLNAKRAYVVDQEMMTAMKGPTKCRRCETECNTPLGIWRHLRGELNSDDGFGPCPKSKTRCSKCSTLLVREELANHICPSNQNIKIPEELKRIL